MDPAVAVLDIGKTTSKLVVFAPNGERREGAHRRNAAHLDADPPSLDLAGIEAWVLASLADASRRHRIEAIVPIGHGAAAALVLGEATVAALDYEAPVPRAIAQAYEAERDPFAATLSPRLADGLNLGVQLLWLESLHPEIWPVVRGDLLAWPQYWAWRLCGVRASEVTSLGCHSDLWRPLEGRFSDLALRRGWAARMPALRRAGDRLGPVRPDLARRLGLPETCAVFCGAHDSNAALVAARAHRELAEAFTLVSTGTWFVCARSGGATFANYDPAQDMLAGVDVAGNVTPMARFMGGRDYEAALGSALGAVSDPGRLAEAEASGGGSDPVLAATRAALDLARRTHDCLDLIKAEGPVVIEGSVRQRRADDRRAGGPAARTEGVRDNR